MVMRVPASSETTVFLPPVGRILNHRDATNARILWCLFFGSWIFDYHAAVEDSFALFVQTVALVVCLVAFCLVFAVFGFRAVGRRVVCVMFCLAVYVADGIIVGLESEQGTFTVIALSVPSSLMLAAIVITPTLLEAAREHIGKLAKDLLWIMAAATVFKLVLVFGILGRTLDEVRYEVLASGVMTLSAYVALRFATKMTIRDICLGALNFGAIAISVTRTQLVVAAGQLLACFVVNPRSIMAGGVFQRTTVLSGMIIAMLAFGALSDNAIIQRWLFRLIGNSEEIGYDVTAATRLAEIQFQVSSIFDGPASMLAGHGMAATNHLVGYYNDLVQEAIGSYELEDVGFGHNLYTSMIFQSGLIAGGLGVGALAYLFLQALIWLKTLLPKAKADIKAFLGAWGAVSVIGVTIYGFLGSTLEDRGYSIYFGAAIGMMFWAKEQTKSTKRSKRQPSMGANRS